MAFDTSQALSIQAARTINVGRGNSGASPETATKLYELTFTDQMPNNIGESNATEGGGFINFFGNSGAVGILGTNIYYDTINDDPLFPGTIEVLRDRYFSDINVYSFENQTMFISHPQTQKFYMRMRIKFSSNWQWGNDQLKFCKNKGPSTGAAFSTNCPKFRSTQGRMYVTKMDDFGANEQSLYPTDPSVFGESPSAYHIEDDIINDFGGAGVDASFTPVNDQWYWFEWEIDSGTAGQSDGYYRIWIDGQLYLSKDNVPVKRSDAGAGFDGHELGHVWEDGVPTEEISMYWHSIEIYDKRPDNLPVGIA